MLSKKAVQTAIDRMPMNEFFSKCFTEMLRKGSVLVSFNGVMTSNVIADTLGMVESKMNELLETSALRKRLYNVLVECLQNLYHHADTHDAQGKRLNMGAFVLSKGDNEDYLISIGNIVDNEKKIMLKDKIDGLNRLSKDELKELYKDVLNNQTFSEKGGGGLGLIDIARRTGNPIGYDFIPYDDNYLFFRMNVLINV